MATFMMMESGVPGKGGAVNPSITNNQGCVGLIQFCSDGDGRTKRMAGNSYSLTTIRATKAAEQLKYVDLYFQENKLKKGASLDELYLTVLAPARRNITDPNANLNVPEKQSSYLYSSAGYITRNSLLAGLTKNVSQRLSIPTSDIKIASSSTESNVLGNAVASGLSNLASVLSGVFSRANCTPPPFTQSDFITYTGCGQVVATAGSLAGMGFGSAAPGIGALATGSSPNVNGISGEILNSPTKGMFAYPIEKSITFTSGFKTAKRPNHFGIDLAGPVGLKILATADGIATIRNQGNTGYGLWIEIAHAGNVYSRYGHLSQTLITSGQQVKQGQVIGLLGNSGGSTGPHLHFEIRINGNGKANAVNPAQYIQV